MRTRSRWLQSLLIGSILAAPAIVTSCAERVTYHDAYYNDDHVWDRNEVVYYTQWEHETHRDHKDFKARSADEQKEYWTWRHTHQNK